MLMEFSLFGIYEFVLTYKWWLAAIVPFVLAVMVLRTRG